MAAVNAAAIQTARSVSSELSVFQAIVRCREGELQPAIELIGNLSRLLESDRIVFWGDWLHMRSYIAALSSAGLESELASSISPDEIERHLFLADLDREQLRKVAIVGTTLVLDSSLDRRHEPYGARLRQLYGNSGLVYLRDAFSAGLVESWRKSRDSCGGLDGAFFYRPQIPAESDFRSPRSGAGYFIGRTPTREVRSVQRFISQLLYATGTESFWIPWFSNRPLLRLGVRGKADTSRALHPGGRMRRAFGSGGSPLASGQLAVDELIQEIRLREFVVTDTYHLAVIAWAQGVPCVLIGTASNAAGDSVNSGGAFEGVDKRLALSMTLDAMPYFVPREDLASRSAFKARLDYLASCVVGDVQLANHVRDHVRSRRDALLPALKAWAGPE